MTGSGSATQLWVGIGAGLLSGASMSLAYLISRHHTLSQPSAARGPASIDLLVRAHVIMGLVCAPAAVWLRPDDLSTLRGCLPALAAAAGLYLVGNVVFIGLLRRTEASRLTPFLGLKIFMLAMAVAFVLREPLTGRQWLAVSLCIAATALLQGTAGGLSWRAFGQVLIVCLSFALSDLFIVRLIDALDAGGAPAERGRFTAALLAMLLNYVVCGIACGLVLVGRRGGAAPAADGWRAAAIYSATWLVAMATLYVCFGCVGAVLGNVVQSTRGIMSVVFGAALAHLGWHELEQRVDRATLLRRVGAAALMTAAIAVYVF